MLCFQSFLGVGMSDICFQRHIVGSVCKRFIDITFYVFNVFYSSLNICTSLRCSVALIMDLSGFSRPCRVGISDVTNESSTGLLTDLRMRRSCLRVEKQFDMVLEMQVRMKASLSVANTSQRLHCARIRAKSRPRLTGVLAAHHKSFFLASLPKLSTRTHGAWTQLEMRC